MMANLTRDHFFNGNVVLTQPKSGYRFSIDAVLLSHFVDPSPAETILDLGTGCGVIPIMLAFRHPDIHLVGVEIQRPLFELACRNVEDNQMTHRVHILRRDMASLTVDDIEKPVDRVVANPPYRQLDSGRINADNQKAVARHELRIDLDRLLLTARRLLNKSGRLNIIYPSLRMVDLLSAMRSSGLEPKLLTMIHSNPTTSARLIAVEAVKGGRPGLAAAPPFYIYKADGSYTKTVAAMFAE